VTEKGVFNKVTAWPPWITEMYLSRGKLDDFFPSPTRRHSSYAHNNTILHPSPTRSVDPMAYFNHVNNDTFYPASTTSGEFGAYPFLGQMSANDEGSVPTSDPFANGWGVGGQGGYMDSEPMGFQAVTSFGEDNSSLPAGRRLTRGFPESVPLVTSQTIQTHDYGQPPYPEYYWPPTDQYAQPDYSGATDLANYFANTMTLEAPVEVPTPSSSKRFFLPWNRVIQYSPITSRSTRLLGGISERAVHQRTLCGKSSSPIILTLTWVH